MKIDRKVIHQGNTKLKQFRHERGWSQQKLAEQIGTTTENVCRWERGKTCPGPYYKYRLSIVFEVSLQELGLTKTPGLYLSPTSFDAVLMLVNDLTQEIQQLRQMVHENEKQVVSISTSR